MSDDLRQHLKVLNPNLNGDYVKNNSGYEDSICQTLNMQIAKCRYWDATWKHHYLEFKKERSIWLDQFDTAKFSLSKTKMPAEILFVCSSYQTKNESTLKKLSAWQQMH